MDPPSSMVTHGTLHPAGLESPRSSNCPPLPPPPCSLPPACVPPPHLLHFTDPPRPLPPHPPIAPQVVAFCREKNVGLVVVGPEVPLVAGLADDLQAAGIPTWGPSAKAAQLEGSKAFMKVGGRV